MALRRASAVFKSVSHIVIFIVERNTLNVPGGKVENEDFPSAAVREVQEEMGGWPPHVSQNFNDVPYIDCGLTR